jgi:periplasmic protein CpxP/Spy
MSPLTHRIAISAPVARAVTIAALMGATMLASPLSAARADGAANPAHQLAQAAAAPSQAAAETTDARSESIEQRITSLHEALQISPKEESDWNNVAQAMRENAAAMENLASERMDQAPQSMTAVQDLAAYEKYAQAHVDGLKNLIASFTTLYDSMPDAQKKNADEVFQSFGHKGASSHS